jgi:hypothetical protein
LNVESAVGEENVLRDVLGVGLVPDEVEGQKIDLFLIGLDELPEGLLVARCQAVNEVVFVAHQGISVRSSL